MYIIPASPSPEIVIGAAFVADEEANWRVMAGGSAALEFTAILMVQ